MLHCSVTRRAACEAEVAAAIAAIDGGPGIYFGCDAGVAGLHPLQGVLLAAPSLALHVFIDGVTVTAHDALGDALLAHDEMTNFVAATGRRASRSPLLALRAFLRPWNGKPGVCLVGALRFEAHRLSASAAAAGVPVAGDSSALGVLYFSAAPLCRDAAGAWSVCELHFGDAGLAKARAKGASSAARQPARGDDGERVVADDFAPGAYAAVVERAVQRLARTPLVSLTLSQSFRREVGAGSVAPAFERLRAVNPAPATFFFNAGAGERVFGASPDLQLRVQLREVEAFPVCGTVARGHGPVGEADSLRRLLDEDVDAASLAVCSDALRNDLAPLCEPGSLHLRDRRRPMALATVVHTVDRLAGRLREGIDAWDAIVATAAPVMATGTPRQLALAAIDALEAGPRGWYGGLVLQVGADGNALVGTILRAAAVRGGIAEVRTGGDLLADSEPAREEEESRLKAVSLWRALGLAVAADLQASVADGGRERRGSGASLNGLPVLRVALCDGQGDACDPFGAAMKETLLGLGVQIDATATTRVVIGGGAAGWRSEADGAGGLVAVGDAAAQVLQYTGFAVRSIRPEHGRIVRCVGVEGAPWHPLRAFFAARYATLAVDWCLPSPLSDGAGWTSWLRQEDGPPLVVVHAARGIACLLFRPDSLISEGPARDLLRAAIAFVAEASAHAA